MTRDMKRSDVSDWPLIRGVFFFFLCFRIDVLCFYYFAFFSFLLSAVLPSVLEPSDPLDDETRIVWDGPSSYYSYCSSLLYDY